MHDLLFIRRLLGLSQAQLARELGIDRRRLSEVERGELDLAAAQEERLLDFLRRHASHIAQLTEQVGHLRRRSTARKTATAVSRE